MGNGLMLFPIFIFRKEGFYLKRVNFFIIFILISIFMFCFSASVFGAVYENKVFPDLPENLRDVVVIVYYPSIDGYRLYTSQNVQYYSNRLWFRSDSSSSVDRYVWIPSDSDNWELYQSSPNSTLRVWYEKGADGFFYNEDGIERLNILYSNIDLVHRDGGDFFFPENILSDFYDFAITTHSVFLEDYDKPSWWDTIWGGIEDFWDSIGDFLGSALSPLFSIMETIGNIFEGFVNALLDIYEAVNDFFANFIDTITSIFENIFIPEDGYLESKLDETKTLFNNKFGAVLEMKDGILNAISQIQNKEFEGIKIDLSNFFISGLGEYYVLGPAPVNYYSYRIKPWISGLMLFLTFTFFLRKIISVIRGTNPL
jgi:hypothetical protein